jgi:hypothetical protein
MSNEVVYEIKIPSRYSNLTKKEKRLVRKKYEELQKGLCYYCKNPLTDAPTEEIQKKNLNMKLFPKNFLEYPLHLHHNHKTDMTIGTVHAKCNGVLWQYHRK